MPTRNRTVTSCTLICLVPFPKEKGAERTSQRAIRVSSAGAASSVVVFLFSSHLVWSRATGTSELSSHFFSFLVAARWSFCGGEVEESWRADIEKFQDLEKFFLLVCSGRRTAAEGNLGKFCCEFVRRRHLGEKRWWDWQQIWFYVRLNTSMLCENVRLTCAVSYSISLELFAFVYTVLEECRYEKFSYEILASFFVGSLRVMVRVTSSRQEEHRRRGRRIRGDAATVFMQASVHCAAKLQRIMQCCPHIYASRLSSECCVHKNNHTFQISVVQYTKEGHFCRIVLPSGALMKVVIC